MAETDYGPAEFIVAQFDSDRPSPGVVQAILDLGESGTVRLLDLLFVSRHDDGAVEIVELEEIGDEIGMAGLRLDAGGLAAAEDVDAIAELIEPGRAGAILVIEQLWASRLASTFGRAGGLVVHSERISAPVVNAIAAEFESAAGLQPPGAQGQEERQSQEERQGQAERQSQEERQGQAERQGQEERHGQATPQATPSHRTGRAGLIGMAARTAVAGGTATAVSGSVQRHQQAKAQDEYEQQQDEAEQQHVHVQATEQAARQTAQQQAARQAAPQAAPPGPTPTMDG